MRIEDIRDEVKQLKKENEDLLDRLLDLEMSHVEHHTVMVKTFDENYEDIMRSVRNDGGKKGAKQQQQKKTKRQNNDNNRERESERQKERRERKE